MIKLKSDFGNFGNDFSGQIRKNIEKSLRSVTCSEHGKKVIVKWKSKSAKNLDFEISCCCEKLKERALSKLN